MAQWGEQGEDEQIATVVRRLAAAPANDAPASVIEDEVRRSFVAWRGAAVRDFLPVLVEREVSHRLGLRRSRLPV